MQDSTQGEVFEPLPNQGHAELKRNYQSEAAQNYGAAVRRAIALDAIIDPEELQSLWRDEFLTNVIVPHLEHIRNYYRDTTDEYLARGNLSAIKVKELQEVYHKINALTLTIHMCQEWRG